MRLVNNDQIKVGNSGHGILIVVQNALYHALNRGNLNPGFTVNRLVLQPLDVVDFIQGHQILQPDLPKNVGCLLSQRGPVHQEKDSAKTTCFQKPVNHAQNGAGLASARRHGEQDAGLSADYRRLSGLNRPNLIPTEVQTISVPQQIKGHFLQFLIPCGNILFQQLGDSRGTHPAPQRSGRVVRLPQVQKPHAAFGVVLLQIGPAVGSKGKRHLIAAPYAELIDGIGTADITGIILTLVINH